MLFHVGQKGEPGPQGPEGKVRLTGFLLTRHSQSSQVPDCPAKMKQLWKGYSLLSGGGTGTFQDLGWRVPLIMYHIYPILLDI